jgi:lactocepin
MNMNPEDPRRELRDDEIERLLDSPRSADGALGMLFEALTAPMPDAPMPGEIDAMSEYRASRPLATAGARTSRLKSWVAALSVGGGVLLAGGVAAAATGHLHAIDQALGIGSSHHSSSGPNGAPTSSRGTTDSTTPDTGVTPTPPAGGKSTAPGQQGTSPGIGTGKGQGTTNGKGKGVMTGPPGQTGSSNGNHTGQTSNQGKNSGSNKGKGSNSGKGSGSSKPPHTPTPHSTKPRHTPTPQNTRSHPAAPTHAPVGHLLG